MNIIDTHAHIFPPKISEKAVGSISDFYETPMQHKGEAEALLESGKQIGVTKYLVFSTATTPKQVESINRFILSQVAEHEEFIGLGTMHRDFETFEQELVFLKDNGINGIKLHPDFQKFDINDPKMYPIYDLLTQLNMFLLTHAGDYRYGFSHPEKILEIAKAFPKMDIIAAHFGGWSQWDIAKDCLKLSNVYFDTSSTMGFSGLDTAKKMLACYDSSHVFFGTDFPMWDHKKELENFLSLKLPDSLNEDILYNNFCNFYDKYK